MRRRMMTTCRVVNLHQHTGHPVMCLSTPSHASWRCASSDASAHVRSLLLSRVVAAAGVQAQDAS